MKYISKYSFVIVLALVVIACGSDDKSQPKNEDNSVSLSEVNLSGTWLLTAETDVFKESTDEYLKTDYRYSYYVFEDTSDGVKVERCSDYGGWAAYGVKTTEHFYMYVNEEGFDLIDTQTLYRESPEYTDEYSPGFIYAPSTRLDRISDDVLIDHGFLEISGANVNLSEDSYVCIWKFWSSLGTMETLLIIVPYGDDVLELSLQYFGDLEVGAYEFEEYNDNNQILNINISSNSELFWGSVGSNILAPESAMIEITAKTTNELSGTFSFVGQDNESYTGSFSAIFP